MSARKPSSVNGAVVINKPRGVTSHDVVAEVRKILGTHQVGHLGTLDPIATGVLPLLVGKATRLAQFYGARRKRYEGTIRFGFATESYDADGTPLGEDQKPELTRAQLEPPFRELTGCFEQMPPPFSAKKIRGVPAHELAREHKPVELKPVQVEVYEFRLLEVAGSEVRFSIECSPGTYIRSLAHDLGQKVGCGAHLAQIVRTASGEFTVEHAATLEQLRAEAGAGQASRWVIPLEKLLSDMPHVIVNLTVERRIKHGATFEINPAMIHAGERLGELDREGWKPSRLRIFNQSRHLVAIGEAIVPRVYRPVVVLDPAS
jgi:tRNA pseudouridine55 synthase